ncbi:MAG: O-acetyl-ADP-ribose deacetylase [Clostridia bacterium]|nr:O-acetyl-ADP-ribose deacetylase [Clostridia bacterium]
MPFYLVRNDITAMCVDAIVNAANHTLLGGGGVDGAIHRAAGPGLLRECRTLGGCETGDAKLTRAYSLPAKYIIHTVGPVYEDGMHGEAILLASCYRTSLALARKRRCKSIAFPLISAGVYGYPRTEAIRIAADTIRQFLADTDDCMTVYLVFFDRDSVMAGEALFPDIAAYIDDRYASLHSDSLRCRSARIAENISLPTVCADHPTLLPDTEAEEAVFSREAAEPRTAAQSKKTVRAKKSIPALSLEARLEQLDESFSEMLLRLIDESGMTDAQCYKKANIDRKLFSKIRSDKYYKPSKQTVLAFAIALALPLADTREFLEKAGYALSPASKFDIIIEYFIEAGNYDVFAINEALFAFDQPLLGLGA